MPIRDHDKGMRPRLRRRPGNVAVTDGAAVNVYGDRRILAGEGGRGIDVALQRADELDRLALADIGWRLQCGPVLAADFGCGSGGQAARMAAAGAAVIAVDIADQSAAIAAIGGGVTFRRMDIRCLGDPAVCGVPTPFDVVVCQRTLHYLRYGEAMAFLDCLGERMTTTGSSIYISASGIGSELAEGYSGREDPLAQRFSPLSAIMQEKHGILAPVCLWSTEELAAAVVRSGFRITWSATSPFGNAKVAGTRKT
jgi:SAM-dependent methyltransferase